MKSKIFIAAITLSFVAANLPATAGAETGLLTEDVLVVVDNTGSCSFENGKKAR